MTPRAQFQRLGLAFCLGIGCSPWQVAFAETPGAAAPPILTTAATASSSAGQASSADHATPVRITVGRASDIVGRPMFAARESFSESAGVVGFSATRPRLASRRSASLSVVPQAATGGPTPARPRFYPLNPSAVTSGYGGRVHPILGTWRGHSGVDLAAPAGTPIAATSDGVVSFANWAGGYGFMVAVDHGGGMQTRYGHMSRIAVSPGQRVKTGEVLGLVGSTGLSTGPHVHYEVRYGDRAINPAGSGK